MKLLLIGPLPPPIGGASVSFKLLHTEIKKRNKFQIDLVDTSELSPFKSFFGSLRFISNLFSVVGKIYKSDVVSFHASTKRYFVYGAYLKFWCSVLNKPLQTRLFGSSIKETYQNSNIINRILIRYVLQSDQALIQTKGLLLFFKNEISSKYNIKWFPTSRPLNSKIQEKNNSHTIKFIYVGHIRNEKGIDTLLDAIEILNEKNLNFSLDLYGSIYDNRFKERFNKIENVNFKGEVRHDKLLKALTQYDVMVFPTHYEGEGYPGTIIESLISGVPVITTQWKYIPELIRNNHNGILVPIRDSQKLADAMNKVITDTDYLEKLKNNVQKSSHEFDSTRWNGEIYENWILELGKQ
jgi:glycosyltransferase involved in cell wall biosynthesis